MGCKPRDRGNIPSVEHIEQPHLATAQLPAEIADFRGGAICLFRTHFLGWSGRFFHGFDGLRRLWLVSPAFGCGPSPSSAWVSNQFTPLRRQAIRNGVEQGHGTRSNRLGMKDLWPSASRSGLTVIALF